MQVYNNTNYSLNFKATKVATTYNYVRGNTSIDVFRLSTEDKKFLDKLLEKISIKNLCPKLSESVQSRWQKVFDYCIQEAKENLSQSYIAITNGKPCGILTYRDDGMRNNFLSGVCSIPNPNGKKTPLAGHTLLYQIFKDSSEQSPQRGIVLEAIHNGPVDVVKKYEDIGFTQIAEIEDYTVMSCNKFKVTNELKNFEKQIEYESVEPEKVNLESLLY